MPPVRDAFCFWARAYPPRANTKYRRDHLCTRIISVDVPYKPPQKFGMSDLRARVQCIVIASLMNFNLGRRPRTDWTRRDDDTITRGFPRHDGPIKRHGTGSKQYRVGSPAGFCNCGQSESGEPGASRRGRQHVGQTQNATSPLNPSMELDPPNDILRFPVGSLHKPAPQAKATASSTEPRTSAARLSSCTDSTSVKVTGSNQSFFLPKVCRW